MKNIETKIKKICEINQVTQITRLKVNTSLEILLDL